MTLRIIAGTYKGRHLKAPKASSTRPTQGMLREAVFNICQNEMEGASFLDLFAGSGAMGLEAISRGASAVLVEKGREAALCIKENLKTLGITSEARLLTLDAAKAVSLLAKEGASFDFIYIDPPYDSLSLELLDSAAMLLKAEGTLFIEERYDPSSKKKPVELSGKILKSSRRFGIALLHQYKN
jgi:16S rRNA (guanine966-N2)-methyltransferase